MHHIGCFTNFFCGLIFPFRGNDLCAPFSFSFGLPGFVGSFDGSGDSSASLIVPYFVQLDTFPLYFQLMQTGPLLDRAWMVQRRP